MRRLVLLLALFLVPVAAFADPAADGSCAVAPDDAAGTLVSDVEAIPAPTPAPTLDLKTLADRLRATHAVGLFGKLAIKGRVDSLMEKAAAATTDDARAELRPEFDSLMADVMKQLRSGGDPALAADVGRSADALWKLLLAQHA